MTWKLTESVKFNQCEDILQALRRRLEAQNKTVSEFVVDTSCMPALRVGFQHIV